VRTDLLQPFADAVLSVLGRMLPGGVARGALSEESDLSVALTTHNGGGRAGLRPAALTGR